MKNPFNLSTNKILDLKKRSRVETQPRFKIQYPMKNHGKDGELLLERRTLNENYLYNVICI